MTMMKQILKTDLVLYMIATVMLWLVMAVLWAVVVNVV